MRKIALALLFCLWGVASLEAANLKVVMVIAHNGFRDEELFITKKILEEHGIKVEVASSSLTMAKGMLEGVCKPDLLLKDINIDHYAAIIFVGGVGATEYWDNPIAHKLIKEAVVKHKVVAAICIAPVTLAKAGILKGKKATVWPSEAEQLEAMGAIYTGKPVERDGLIITANGPQAVNAFADTVLRALKQIGQEGK